ncbi:MAG: Holliday junction branch migration protein RuvA [Bacteroidales bacterium]|nr:Holliday junction branch migration protein RuvA [Bacteroidales bacterium]MDY2934776.1 Holliday junction branch migration protein RuvA [Candidatus Cryptobacteroides sp.]
MIDYVKGKIVELSPMSVVIDNNGIGYSMLISLQTYQALEGKADDIVYIHHHIRQDDEEYYGFATKDERELFELLIGVSGVGVGSARMMLSSLSAEEIRQAILSDDVAKIKSVKGIGLKSAQKVIIELKDKIVKGEGADSTEIFAAGNNEIVEEACRALIMLGFSKQNVNKAVQSILKANPKAKVEDVIKSALKML